MLDVVLPARCVGCGTSRTYLCGACLAGAKPALPAPLPDASPLSGLMTPFAYTGIARTAVHHLKYRGLRAAAPPMAKPMARDLALTLPPPFVLFPVPLHRKRLRERGYNQAELLAKQIAGALEAPLRTRVLERTKPAPPQVSAPDRRQRLSNVRDAFAAAPLPPGTTAVLVDDVVTTGATIEASARALLAAGAARVYGLAFAHED